MCPLLNLLIKTGSASDSAADLLLKHVVTHFTGPLESKVCLVCGQHPPGTT